jgi:hypothetical protein
MMQTVELFSGTRSFSKVAEQRGYKTFCIEMNKSQDADLHKNILDVTIKDLPKKVDIVWASPPCTTFSVATSEHGYVNGVPTTLKAALGLAYVLKTLELISELKKRNEKLIWFIENPMGYLRTFQMMKRLHKQTVWYCQCGDFRAKPTDIWNNLFTWIGKKCSNDNMACNHERSPRGSKVSGTQKLKGNTERSVIPAKLFHELFDVIENKAKVKQEVLNIGA